MVMMEMMEMMEMIIMEVAPMMVQVQALAVV